jgi:3-methylcrotonyl-CoA carboxylase alpha subunit
LPTNVSFLQTILHHPQFQKWEFDTNFISKFKNDLITKDDAPEFKSTDILATVLAKIIYEKTNFKPLHKTLGPWNIKDNFRVNYKAEREFKLKTSSNDEGEKTTSFTAFVKYIRENVFNVRIVNVVQGIDVVYQEVKIEKTESPLDIILNIKGDSMFKAKYYLTPEGHIRILKTDGSISHLDFVFDDYGIVEDHDLTSKGSVKAPMPCSVSKIFVTVGQTVKKGDNLIALEAMKMEHLLKSSRSGKIKAIHVKEGKFIEFGTVLIEFEEELEQGKEHKKVKH